MKRIIILLFTLLPLIGTSRSHAQWNYVIDNLRGDAVDVYQRLPGTDKYHEFSLGEKVFSLNNGEKVVIAANDSVFHWLDQKIKKGSKTIESTDLYATVTINGEQYFVKTDALMFGENPEGVTDLINPDKDRHSRIYHIYYTGTPYWLVLILMTISFLLFLFSGKALNGILAIFPIIFVFCAVAIELIGTFYVGKDMLWWLDKNQFTMGQMIFYLFLFVLTLLMQLISIIPLKGGADVVVWRPILFAILGVIAFIICIAISGTNKELDENKMLYLGVGLAIGITVIGIISALARNIRELGFILGLLFSIFSIIWAVGACVAITLFIMGFLKVLWEMILTIIVALFVFFIMSRAIPVRRYTKADGTIVEVYEH